MWRDGAPADEGSGSPCLALDVKIRAMNVENDNATIERYLEPSKPTP
jgi:hypothetical protein